LVGFFLKSEMSAEPPPYDGSAGYNPDNWTPDSGTGAVDEEYLATNYLQFPIAQGSETLGDAIISGTFTAQDVSTFSDIVNLNSDTTATGNFTINSNTGATNTVLIQPPSTLNGSVIMNGTLTANAQATFAGDASTGNANAPIKLTNGVAGEYATLYLNPSSGEDITLYTNQNPLGGLTIRGANNASFTMNPGTVQDGSGCVFNNPLSMNGNTLSGLVNVYGNNGGTIAFQNVANFNAGATLTTTPTALQTTNVANVQYVADAIANINFSTYAPLASPAFTGTPTYGGNTLATVNQIPSLTPYAPLASPAFTGTPTISTTPTSGQTTAIADVNYVNSAVSGSIPSLVNYAQLNTATAQTFTGAVNFTGTLQSSSVTVATTNDLPIITYSSISTSYSLGGTVLATGPTQVTSQNISLVSGSPYISFYSSPIFINFGTISSASLTTVLTVAFTVNGVPVKPWPDFEDNTTYGVQYCTAIATGGGSTITQSWPVQFYSNSGNYYLSFLSYSNMGNGSSGTYDLSTLGVFANY
jgi:hypothetical protein